MTECNLDSGDGVVRVEGLGGLRGGIGMGLVDMIQPDSVSWNFMRVPIVVCVENFHNEH